ncbi:response regulator [Actinospongicola halichondriae]|uniref:response regulator n=1 Tax=Actinospongicola halichondriae TaxID=3236844 RepID=UPI003D45A6CF
MTTVLVVDDDHDIQLLLRLELQAEGYVVVTADNGLEALDRIPVVEPDVVLLDVMMPELDGWGVLEQLDEPKPAVIVISGLASDRAGHYRNAIELGALGFVSKPFDSAKLLELVQLASTLDATQRVDYRQWLLDGGADAG